MGECVCGGVGGGLRERLSVAYITRSHFPTLSHTCVPGSSAQFRLVIPLPVYNVPYFPTLPYTDLHLQVWVKVLSTVPAGDAAPGPGGKPQRVTLSMRDVDQVIRGGEGPGGGGGGC